MDVERNPDQDLDEQVVNNNGKQDLSYSKSKIITLQKVATKPNTDIIERHKINQLFKYRCSRGGNRGDINGKKISVIVGRRPLTAKPTFKSYENLIKIKRSGLQSATVKRGHFAVPKCLFLNICSLLNIKNGVKAPLPLEGDLYVEGIDICVILESHLNHCIPDSAFGISNYTIYRRDRDCFGSDNRKKGGVAIYMRNNLKVKSIITSERF